MILRQSYVDKIMSYVNTPFVKILSGVRRCGKSTILKMVEDKLRERGIKDEQILVYQLDSMKYDDIKNASLFYNDVRNRLANDRKTYLFFDEIQEVEEWEKAVNSLMTDFDVDIYVTGSNSRMLSSEISTYLTGRYISFRIFPLSFSEYLMFRETRTSLGETRQEFARYLRYGGFPAIHLQDYSADEVYTIVKDIYNSTIFTDIVKRNQIRKVDQFERIVRFVFDNIGRTFSASAIAKYLKSEHRTIDNETVMGYLAKLESAFIIHRCFRYDLQGKEILKTQEKFYVCDPAIKYGVLGYRPDSVAAMLENVVYLELLRRGYDVNVGLFADGEIDFVASKQENKLYIQIAQLIQDVRTKSREYGRFSMIKDNYPKYVLRTDEFAGGNQDGIITMHVADFLLSNEY
ncbi:MAG: ATP-binding protein [Lachnospiraceae bacterium]|nr:ATP-binding protein [Lachnospiraceae bacterium]